MFVLDDISIEQLFILGITDEYLFMLCSLIGIFILFLCLKPIILFLHYRHYTIVLTYIISSLLIFILLSLYMYITGDLFLIKFSLQCIAIFGGCIGLYMFYLHIKHTYSR